MNKEKLIEFLRSNAEISVTVEPEIEGPEGSFDSGDAEQDAKDCAKIRADSEWNEWAWCMVKVTAKYKTWEGHDYLGGCSYESEADFRADGYYKDMIETSLEALADKIINTDADLQSLWLEI